jgi:hypothetical protein
MSAPNAIGSATTAVVWVPCATCWGQRQILEVVAAANGEGDLLVPHSCPGCLGVGEVPRA